MAITGIRKETQQLLAIRMGQRNQLLERLAHLVKGRYVRRVPRRRFKQNLGSRCAGSFTCNLVYFFEYFGKGGHQGCKTRDARTHPPRRAYELLQLPIVCG